ncbi:hypothetical protein J2D73_16640 [Acetobacter sacchari]|uniref:Ornithine decarboxylase antizyme n=1 Tax=Acetobacter sacchari TaxID=2661687 RepID=A0ABS3LZU3_9PROT|nr:hypothetical protein [Acetobacter sacchari]MBO1361414.1 hypothetical protein [Acetobacter sacchari]
MAFISTVLNGGTYEERSFVRDTARTTVVCIGYDSADPISYSLLADISPSQNGNELFFCLVETFNDVDREILDSSEACSIIPKYSRGAVRAVLLKMILSLIRSTDIDDCYMVTFCAHLPLAALTKYHDICKVFETCGFQVEHEGPDACGKHIWMMSKA